MKKLLLILLSLGFLFVNVSGAGATNITIYDENGYYGSGAGGEDGETEPGMINNQSWDLEAFVLNGTKLSLIGGYDFINGVGGYTAGDIFLDFNGGAQYGDIHDNTTSGNQIVQDTFGFDVVLAMTWDDRDDVTGNPIYDFAAIELSDNSQTITTHYTENQGSNPWRYAGIADKNAGNDKILGLGEFSYFTGTDITDQYILDNFGIELSGGLHNVVTIDLSFLAPTYDINNMLVKNTMQCGNDSIVGQTPVPEPATMVLFGIGLIGLAGIGRRKVNK